MGIPKHNGLRDDVQVLWSGSALANYFYDSPTDIGPGTNQYIWAALQHGAHAPICGPETIAPGLTVNGCNSPTGAAGQIAATLHTSPFFGGPYSCATNGDGLRPDLHLVRR